MRLDPAAEQRIRAEAVKRGVDPAAAIAHAESLAPKDPPAPSQDAAAPDKGARPLFDRLLLGALPFVRVREFRSVWLGLTERIPDDDLMCGEFAAKHGGASASPGTSAGEPA